MTKMVSVVLGNGSALASCARCAAAALVAAAGLVGCATAPQAPPEAAISVALPGTANEVQQYLEDRTRAKGIYRIEQAAERQITFKTDCMNVPEMNAFKCSLVMMGVGNSGWSGPWSVLTFRTNQVREVVNLSVDAQWCATNAFGKTNCMQSGTNAQANALLRDIEAEYKAKRGS